MVTPFEQTLGVWAKPGNGHFCLANRCCEVRVGDRARSNRLFALVALMVRLMRSTVLGVAAMEPSGCRMWESGVAGGALGAREVPGARRLHALASGR
jgi:hypothetical protein